MSRELAFRTPLSLAVAENATTPSAEVGTSIWSTTAGKMLTWNGTAWVAGGAGPIYVSATAPTSPFLNQLWIDLS